MKKVIKISFILLSILCMVTTVYAASCNMSLQTAKDELSKNDEFVVDATISSISDVGEGIIALGATLEYDKNALTLVEMKGENGWSNPTYNEANGVFTMDRSALVNTPETVLKMTFKVKDDSSKNATIALKNITASGGIDTGDIPVSNISKTITIKGETQNPTPDNNTNTNNNQNTNTNITANTNTNNNQSGNTNNNSNKNTNGNQNNNKTVNINSSNGSNPDSTKKGILPKTGATNIILVVLIGAVALAVVFYVKFKTIDKNIK